ncbi:MAG: ABC transporter ATP-binding protein [Candidatus Firestonebacteria bacterium]
MLEIKNLKKYFKIQNPFQTHKNILCAVDGVSLKVLHGETLGLVGESGCGKTTLGKSILRLIEPSSGEIFFEGTNILNISERELKKIRVQMQMIFQNPYASLNPRIRIGEAIGEILEIHKLCENKMIYEKVVHLLEIVGLQKEDYYKYPHEFSGGQRQRICIARAIASTPKFIVADEPVSSLDVLIQAQIIKLLFELQEKFNLSYLFISHDLRIVEQICNRVAVMYLGKIIEEGINLSQTALHPYTKALISAVPKGVPGARLNRIRLQGDPPSPFDFPKGCRFHPRCYIKNEICTNSEPSLREIEPCHYVSCHLIQ